MIFLCILLVVDRLLLLCIYKFNVISYMQCDCNHPYTPTTAHKSYKIVHIKWMWFYMPSYYISLMISIYNRNMQVSLCVWMIQLDNFWFQRLKPLKSEDWQCVIKYETLTVPIPRLFRQGHCTYAEDVNCCGNTQKERYVGSSAHIFGNCSLLHALSFCCIPIVIGQLGEKTCVGVLTIFASDVA